MRVSVRGIGVAAVLVFAVLLIKNHLELVRGNGDIGLDQPFWNSKDHDKPLSAPEDMVLSDEPNDNLNDGVKATTTTIAEVARPTFETIPIDTPNDRTIVMAKLSHEDTSWVANELNEWRSMIYTVDDPSATHHTPKNKGRESLAYLKYIVDHYNSLPKLIIFLHSHRSGWPGAWHTDAYDYSNVESVRTLKADFVQQNGYVNLRCMDTPGCPEEIKPFRSPPDPAKEAELYYAQAYYELFNSTEVPETVAVACCSQFAVSRDQVLKRPLSDYERFYNWVLDSELSDELIQRILEYSWHIIFGMDPVYCPDVFECYRTVYGYNW